MKIEINTKNNDALHRPSCLIGRPYGEVWEMVGYPNPSKNNPPSYFITTGINDNPLILWYSSEDQEYRISSQSCKDLEDYVLKIMVRKVKASVVLKLDIGV